MPPYKAPSFADRQAAAATARDKAIAKLKARPAPDPEVLEARREAAERKRIASEEARAAKEVAREEAKAAAEAAVIAAAQAVLDAEAEAKAERDRRYAARKAGGKGRK